VRISVVGAGSWGTTLASLFSDRNETILWARDPGLAEEIALRHHNPVYLEGHRLSPSLRATDDLGASLEGADVVVVAVPSRFFRNVVESARPFVPQTADVVSVAKGIEVGTGARMSEVLAEVLGADVGRISALTGPNLAKEVLAKQPSATVLACADAERAERLQRAMTTDWFRVFTNRDLVGCEIGGAVKNVIAIAAGIGDGLGYGWNTKAALITRGLAEIARLGVALGANPITFLGLAGYGDLTATCSSPQSRNRHVGEGLGAGRPLSEIIGAMNMVAEGVTTTPAIAELARRHHVPMPITRKVAAVLGGTLSPAEAVLQLMTYEPGSELGDLVPMVPPQG